MSLTHCNLSTDFVVSFAESVYSYSEGENGSEVCLNGVGEIAEQATATISSLAQGTATGTNHTHCPIYTLVSAANSKKCRYIVYVHSFLVLLILIERVGRPFVDIIIYTCISVSDTNDIT